MMDVVSIVHFISLHFTSLHDTCRFGLFCMLAKMLKLILFLTRSQLSSMYILLVSVAVKHVLDEVLDRVTHITQYFIINTTHGLRYGMKSFILAL